MGGRHSMDKEDRVRYKPMKSDYLWSIVIIVFITVQILLRWLSDHADQLPGEAEQLLAEAQEAEADDDIFTHYAGVADNYNNAHQLELEEKGLPVEPFQKAEIIELTDGNLCVVIHDKLEKPIDWAGVDDPELCFWGSDGTQASWRRLDIQNV